MISNKKDWHCIAIKRLSALLRGITSKDNGDLYSLNCLHSFRTENKQQTENNVMEKCVKIKPFMKLLCQL